MRYPYETFDINLENRHSRRAQESASRRRIKHIKKRAARIEEEKKTRAISDVHLRSLS